MLSMILGFLNIGTSEMLVIMLAILLLFGGKKLPELARGLGRGIREFKDASESIKRDIQEQIHSVEKAVDPKSLILDDVEEEIKSALPPQKAESTPKTENTTHSGSADSKHTLESDEQVLDEEDSLDKKPSLPKLGPPPGTFQHNPTPHSFDSEKQHAPESRDEQTR